MGSSPEEHPVLTVALRTFDQSTVGSLPTRSPGRQGSALCLYDFVPGDPRVVRELSTLVVGPEVAIGDARRREITSVCEIRQRHFDRPETTFDPREVSRIDDRLVPNELRPRSVGSVRKVLSRTIAYRMPTRRRLVPTFPSEREPEIAMTKEKSRSAHAAPEPDREAARSRTCPAERPSGSNPPLSNASGD